jgi:mRNA interferase RelE/StbE
MPRRSLKVPAELRSVVRRLHPEVKRKLRSALDHILNDPTCGKPLKDELEGYWSFRLGRIRIIYRPADATIEVVAIGPRESVYDEVARAIRRDKA